MNRLDDPSTVIGQTSYLTVRPLRICTSSRPESGDHDAAHVLQPFACNPTSEPSLGGSITRERVTSPIPRNSQASDLPASLVRLITGCAAVRGWSSLTRWPVDTLDGGNPTSQCDVQRKIERCLGWPARRRTNTPERSYGLKRGRTAMVTLVVGGNGQLGLPCCVELVARGR